MSTRISVLFPAILSGFVGIWFGACGDATTSDNGGSEDGGTDGGPGRWTPPQVHYDVPYIQEVGVDVGELSDVRAVALDADGAGHVATVEGILRREGDAWVPLELPVVGEMVDLAFDEAGTLGAVGPAGAVIGGATVDLPQGAVATFIAPRSAGGWWLAGGDLAGFWGGTLHSIYEDIQQPVHAVCDLPDGTWFAATPEGVFSQAEQVTTEHGRLPSNNVRALAVGEDGTVWAGTDAGMAVRDPVTGEWTPFLGEDGLHYGDILDLAFDHVGTLLVSTGIGASAFYTDGRKRYYLGRNWMPDDHVRGMARASDGTVWFATAGGVSRVEQREMPLSERAALYDRITQERHVRLGYTSTECRLREAGDVSSFYGHDDDNDGQWTGMYLASQSFRYAATGDPEARENARMAAYALMKLEEVTGVDGFFARSIVPGEECEAKQQGDGEWHLSGDGIWCWKGDTSSDEFVGHIFGLSIFYDLAATAEEREDVARTVGRIVGYIIDCGYTLDDVDGLPTTHGHFDPEWMENDLSARFGDAGLNSAMILGGLHAAYHMTGESRFRESFNYLARERNYADYVSRIEEINLLWHTNHDSEEMSFLAMYTLMRYERDPLLLTLWRKGLDYLWEVQRPERDPEFNMIYAALARTDEYDLEQSIETLQRLPLNLVLWGLDNGYRWDREEDPRKDRHGELQNLFVFPYDERQVMRWAENPYAYRQRGDGRQEASGTFWLLPYWMGRYYGIIQ